jgi:hypothetical protein
MVSHPGGCDERIGMRVIAVYAHPENLNAYAIMVKPPPPLTINKKNGRRISSAPVSSGRKFWKSLFLLLQERKTCALILGDLISCRKRIDSALLGLTTEVVKSYLLTATKFLEALMKEISFAAFLADDAE